MPNTVMDVIRSLLLNVHGVGLDTRWKVVRVFHVGIMNAVQMKILTVFQRIVLHVQLTTVRAQVVWLDTNTIQRGRLAISVTVVNVAAKVTWEIPVSIVHHAQRMVTTVPIAWLVQSSIQGRVFGAVTVNVARRITQEAIRSLLVVSLAHRTRLGVPPVRLGLNLCQEDVLHVEQMSVAQKTTQGT